MSARKVQSRNPINGFLDLIQKYWLLILGIIFATPVLLRYLRDSKTLALINNNQENEKVLVNLNENPITQTLELSKITTNPFYHNLARNIAKHLGTNIQTKETSIFSLSMFNPRGWTENDKEAYLQLKQITNSGQLSTVVKCYYTITRRNLIDDVKRLLDYELLIKLPLFK